MTLATIKGFEVHGRATRKATFLAHIYLGNDLNDLAAMRIAGLSVAPSDSHLLILKQADLVMPQKGGEGFVRAFIEILLGIEEFDLDTIKEFF